MSEEQVSFLHALVMDWTASQAHLDRWLVPALRQVGYGEIANTIIELRAELRKWQTGAIVGIEFVPKMFDELERQCDALRTENALLKAEPGQSLVLRCGELEAEIADMREHFSVAAENLLALERENKKVCKALSDLYDACMQADGEGELHYTIDGDLLDAARVALGGEDASNAAEK